LNVKIKRFLDFFYKITFLSNREKNDFSTREITNFVNSIFYPKKPTQKRIIFTIFNPKNPLCAISPPPTPFSKPLFDYFLITFIPQNKKPIKTPLFNPIFQPFLPRINDFINFNPTE